MSDRADIVVVRDGHLEIYHHRWGATVLLQMLLGGPESSLEEVCAAERTQVIDDILAGAVIDQDRQTLVIAGPAEVIRSGGSAGQKLNWQEQEILPELAPFWPGWTLGYEPDFVIEPIVHYVRDLAALPLASLNPADAPAEQGGEPRWSKLAYRLEARAAPPAGPAMAVLDRSVLVRRIDTDSLSIRAANELANGGFELVGDLVGASEEELAHRGVSLKVRRELTEVLEADGLSFGQRLPDDWDAWRAEAVED
jgi:hypothetical protein